MLNKIQSPTGLFFKKTFKKFKSQTATHIEYFGCRGASFAHAMATWELNVGELLELVHKAEVPNILVRPEHTDVRSVAVCLSSDEHPLDISDMGTIYFCAEKDADVKLKGKDGGTHQDGKSGELFVQTYTVRKKPKMEELPSSHFVCLFPCVLHFVSCCFDITFVSPSHTCLFAGLSGWWYKNEGWVMPAENTPLTSKYVIDTVTYYGNSANLKSPMEDNWTCIVAEADAAHSSPRKRRRANNQKLSREKRFKQLIKLCKSAAKDDQAKAKKTVKKKTRTKKVEGADTTKKGAAKTKEPTDKTTNDTTTTNATKVKRRLAPDTKAKQSPAAPAKQQTVKGTGGTTKPKVM